MKKRKLKGFVLPTIYVMVVILLIMTISLLNLYDSSKTDYKDMAVSTLIDDGAVPVMNTDVEQRIIKPYNSDKVLVDKMYYDNEDNEERQEQSLVYYENTYLQNSGVLYVSDDSFEVQAVLDGTVTNIDQDEILGNVVEITHNPNLKTVYYSLGDVNVKKDDQVTQGTILGVSGDNNLSNTKSNYLLFEVYYNGTTINPEKFYTMNLADLK